MTGTSRRTATYDDAVIKGAQRVRSSALYRAALVELAGHEPATESAVFNDLAKIALRVIDRRVLELGYRELAASDETHRDPIDEFLAAEALADYDYDDEDPTALLNFLSQEPE